VPPAGSQEPLATPDKMKILLVDDNPDNLISIEAALDTLSERGHPEDGQRGIGRGHDRAHPRQRQHRIAACVYDERFPIAMVLSQGNVGELTTAVAEGFERRVPDDTDDKQDAAICPIEIGTLPDRVRVWPV